MTPALVAKAVEPLWHEGPPVTVFITEESLPTPYEAEQHRAFEVNCLLQGRQMRYSASGYEEVGAGDVCLVPGWEPHAWQSLVPGTTVVTVLFLPEFLGDATVGGLPWLSLFVCLPQQRPRVRTAALRREVMDLARHLARGKPTYRWRRRARMLTPAGLRWRTTGSGSQLVAGGPELPPAWEDGIRYDVLRLLVALYDEWEGRDHQLQQPRTSLGDLSAVMPAIRLTMSRPEGGARADLAQAATACSLSPTHFRRVFRRAMGTTFARFEAQQRVAAAARLLHTTDLTLEAVAERCGFTDASHLNRVFKGFHGHTAGAHREAFVSSLRGGDVIV